MNKFYQWFWCIAFMTLVGWVLGWCLGQTLRRLSLDYVYEVSDYTSHGIRAGMILGSLMGMVTCFRTTDISSKQLLKTGMLLWCAVVGLTLSSGVGMYLISMSGIMEHFIAPWHVGNPNRTAICLGLQFGSVSGAMVFGVMSGYHICFKEGIRREG